MITELGQICSDIEKPEITDIKDCKEAQKWLAASHFMETLDPRFPRGCYAECLVGCVETTVVWNPIGEGQPDPDINAICLNSGKHILVYHFLSKYP